MASPEALALIAVFWIVLCAFVVWLVWRGAKRDAEDQRRAETAETAEAPTRRDDRAA
jgi:hypothetical protein